MPLPYMDTAYIYMLCRNKAILYCLVLYSCGWTSAWNTCCRCPLALSNNEFPLSDSSSFWTSSFSKSMYASKWSRAHKVREHVKANIGLLYVYVQVLYVQVCWTSTCRCLYRCCFNGFRFFGNCPFTCSTSGNLAIVPSHTRLRRKAPRPRLITFGIRTAVPAVVALEAIAVVFVRLLQKEWNRLTCSIESFRQQRGFSDNWENGVQSVNNFFFMIVIYWMP